MADFTKSTHRDTYPAISPTVPANTQAGRTILVTGGTAGIGFAIAQGFVQAGAARVIITGRRTDVLAKAVKDLESTASGTVITGKTCDMASALSIEELWNNIRKEGVEVDVVILNAGMLEVHNILGDFSTTAAMYTVNVINNLLMTDLFIKHTDKKQKKLLFVSSAQASLVPPPPGQGVYGAVKMAGNGLFQNLAFERPAEELTIISIHPGAVLTAAARTAGFDETTIAWDEVALPGDYCVWASSEAAQFLHGRFVHAAWDVEELMLRKGELEADPALLRVGIDGSKSSHMGTFIASLMEKSKRSA